MTVLARIKRLVLSGQFEISEKARIEMFADGLLEQDLIETIANAVRINKTLRSTRPGRAGRREYLYVVISENLQGVSIYTKGKIVAEGDVETYYFFISAKYSD